MSLNSSKRTPDSIPADEGRVNGFRLVPGNRSKDFGWCDVKEGKTLNCERGNLSEAGDRDVRKKSVTEGRE